MELCQVGMLQQASELWRSRARRCISTKNILNSIKLPEPRVISQLKSEHKPNLPASELHVTQCSKVALPFYKGKLKQCRIYIIIACFFIFK